MNYYAQGGQAHGLKALAQELPKYGRDGDSIVAHINPQEAGILKALGGSGTINPMTGLPEYRSLRKLVRSVTKPIQQAVAAINPLNPDSSLSKTINTTPVVGDINKALNNVGTQIFQPLEKAIVKPVSAGLASFDKAVGNTIPGGWGTVGQVALSAMGAPVPLQVGYGAARGSGVMRKGGNFNLQGAMIGGATAYATAKLGDYMRSAAPGSGGISELTPTPTVDAAGNLVTESAMPQLLNAPMPDMPLQLSGPGTAFAPASLKAADVGALNALSAPLEAGAGVGLQVAPAPSIGSNILSGNFGYATDQIGTGIKDAASRAFTSAGEGLKNLGTSTTDTFKAAITPSTYTDAINSAGTNLSQTGAGIKNLITGPAGVSKAASALSGVNPVTMGGMAIFGASSLADLDAQRDFLNQQKAAGNIAQAEYDKAMDSINRQRDYADKVVRENPINPYSNRDVSIGETLYGRTDADKNLYARAPSARSTLYAMGGSVDDESGMDEARGIMQGNLQKGLFGMGYAAGGEPRFLSGGGDGMSDDIPATINGSQPARLADGEFVIPADVVSHIGNGSSKAGAKQLYSMMDKVRKARTGNPKQGKQINPRKYLPA